VSLTSSLDEKGCLVAGTNASPWFREQAFRPLFQDVSILNKGGDEMLKILILLAVTGLVFIQTQPAYCGGLRSISVQISVTIPEHVMVNNNLGAAPFSNNPDQLVQTETVIRNNQSISLTSIVVP